MCTASICTIGDEILIGQIVDTNSSFIARELNKIGIKVVFIASVQDDQAEIESKLALCRSISDIVITTGGLGPTKDDITKRVLGKIYNARSSYYHKEQSEIIAEICKKRGIEVSTLNRDQALVPDCCKVLVNKLGTAPGMVFMEYPDNDPAPKLLFSLPGVPYEMRSILPEVLKRIEDQYSLESIYHKTILTYGIPESGLSEMIADWENALPSPVHLAYLPNPASGVKLRLSVYGEEISYARKLVSDAISGLKPILKESIYGEDDQTLESVVANVLTCGSKTLSVAESCTGGRVASRLTMLAGASNYFKGGVVAYDNNVKTGLLKVDPEVIEKFGAVSSECVIQMAEGVKKLMQTDYSVATSGIAGPSGGSDQKPVGTLWIAISGEDRTISVKVILSGEREQNIERFSSYALNYLRLFINNQYI
jgi:nicotinamide-nucleotide amidase